MLICRSSGKPRPSIQWLKNDIPLKFDRRISVESFGEVHILVIKGATLDDGGAYTFSARNDLGTSVSSAELRVSKKMSRPLLVEKSKEVVAFLGDEARFDVRFKETGKPDQVVWYKDNIKLRDRGKYRITLTEGVYTLIISDVNSDDRGIYKCVASNKAGKTTFLGYLEVTGEKRQYAPYFIDGEGTEPVVASESHKVKIIGLVKANPSATIRWYKEEQLLAESRDYEIISRGDAHYFVIKNAQVEDSGMYRCEAINSLGKAVKSYDVRISGI